MGNPNPSEGEELVIGNFVYAAGKPWSDIADIAYISYIAEFVFTATPANLGPTLPLPTSPTSPTLAPSTSLPAHRHPYPQHKNLQRRLGILIAGKRTTSLPSLIADIANFGFAGFTDWHRLHHEGGNAEYWLEARSTTTTRGGPS